MRILNIVCSLILILTLGLFGAYNYRLYKNSDKDGPVISMEDDTIEVSVQDGYDTLLEGVTAYDKRDGDVTYTIGIESISGFIDEGCTTRQINYVAFDQNSHVAKASRRMVYSDYIPIHFALTDPLKFPEQASNVNILGILRARDCLDGDISKQIVFSEDSTVQIDTAGTYDVVLCVTNSAGDTEELPVTIRIYEKSTEGALPQIALSKYLVYTDVGKQINPYEYIKSVTYSGVEYMVTNGEGTFAVDTSEMTAEERAAFIKQDPEVNINRFNITDAVDYNTPGSYEIKYTIDTLDGERGYVYLVVVVE